jgi:hypothetical protein
VSCWAKRGDDNHLSFACFVAVTDRPGEWPHQQPPIIQEVITLAIEVKVPQFIAVLIAILAIGATFVSPVMATTIQNPTTVTVTEEATNEKHASAGTFIKFKVLSYVKAQGLTKEEVANAEECTEIGEGTDVPVYTNSGISSSGAFVEFEDRDREKTCKIDGVWRLVRCSNIVHFFVKPNIFHGQVLLVKTFAFKKIRIHIPLHVRVPSPCGGSPAESVAKIDQWVRYKAVVKAKGDVKIRISGKIIDRVKAHVRAGATCRKTTTIITEPGCTTCGPPPCQVNCEPPCTTCQPDHKPQISCTFPPHVIVGESQFMWCEASDPDGDTLSVTVKGDSHLQVSSTIPVNERWDGSPCPSGVHCYRSTLWGKSAGTAHIVATVFANGKSAEVAENVSVPEDEF